VPEAYTQSLLLYAYQESARKLTRYLREKGHTSIRPKHGAVFANIDRDGARATVLAERSGMGKAAMGELIDELERLGYVERHPDPADRRAKMVMPTQRALEVTRLVHRFNGRLEASYRELLGDAAYETFRDSLARIVPDGGGMQPRIK
jgi:DNA-binding MarR family transcriptional regulator